MKTEINELIEDLTFYGADTLGLTKEDAIYARNQLLELFKAFPCERKGEKKELNSVLYPMIEYALDKGMIEEGEELRFETKLMGLVSPSAGMVIRNFQDKERVEGVKAATDYLCKLGKDNKYIRMEDINKNIRWYADGVKGRIGITINLSKPEKDNKQVAAERNSTAVKYPKCMLCLENLGFSGTATHPARQTLRIIPITLNGESWHMQYSPYMYYDEHVIAFADEHRPMAVTEKTFIRLLDFVDKFPHYFLGSNADLPIVGGSILSHDHYQGGGRYLPMFSADLEKVYLKSDGLTVGIKRWYNSVVTVQGTDRKKVLETANKVLKLWRGYSDESVEVLAFSGETPHNTITPIATKNGEEFCLDLILRNNRTDEAHPDGIFHPTKDMHNIKKEGIGLIEAMGLFILPGRLKRETQAIKELLLKKEIDYAAVENDETLAKHGGMIKAIADKRGTGLKDEDAQRFITEYINEICLKILECTAVFKHDKKGEEAFDKFMKTVLS